MSTNAPTTACRPEFDLGDRIRKTREHLGLMRAELADLLGVDRKTIGNWEAGRHAPRYRDLALLASVANVDLEWLAGDLYRVDTREAARRNLHRYSTGADRAYREVVAA